jgi:excisionase family DNA binding protein
MMGQVREYLADSGKSADWLGLVIAGNPRLVDDLNQGRSIPWDTEIALIVYMDAFYDAAIKPAVAGTGRHDIGPISGAGHPAPAEQLARPFTAATLARRWGCSTTLVYDLLTSGQLEGFRLGKLWRVSAAAVKAYEGRPGNSAP